MAIGVGISLLTFGVLLRFVWSTDNLVRLASLRLEFLALGPLTFAGVIIFSGAVADRVIRFVPAYLCILASPIAEPMRLQWPAALSLTVALAATTPCGLARNWRLSLALGLTIPWLGLCIAVPAITFVRALPISFNGIGVGGGAFIAVLQSFGVAQGDALVLSLSGTAVHALGGLVGGSFFLWFIFSRDPRWRPRAAS